MSLKILVVSDSDSLSNSLIKPLFAAGHVPVRAPEGEDLYRVVRQEKPALLIVAVQAERVAALAMEHRLHTPHGPLLVPVIVVSASPTLEAELPHIFDFIPLPLDTTRLLQSVAAIAASPARPEAATTLHDALFHQFSHYIHSCTGLHFEARNRSSLERAVNKRMSALRIDSCADYLSYLRLHREDRYELQKLVQFLTVGETYFFRYPSHFDALREYLAERASSRRPVRIWSAGCSTGEEPYSIAIALMQALPDWRERDVKIIATDINRHSLSRARDGVYSPWSLRATDRRHLERYFRQVDEGLVVREEVKGLVEFRHLNLASPGDWDGDLRHLDAIFCRNVLIYFAPEAAPGIVSRLAAALDPSGHLFLGHAESHFQREGELEVRRRDDSFYYVKKEVTAALVPAPAAPALPPVLRQAPSSRTAPSSPVPAPAKAAAGLLESARQLFEREHLDEALVLLQELLAQSPVQTGALVLHGFVMAAKGRFDEALASCQRAIAADDLLPEAYFLKGVVLDACGRLAEAADEYRKALLLDHNFVMPHYHMGRLHFKLGRLSEAAREIRNSIRIVAGQREGEAIPYSGGLTRTGCLERLQNALAQVA